MRKKVPRLINTEYSTDLDLIDSYTPLAKGRRAVKLFIL